MLIDFFRELRSDNVFFDTVVYFLKAPMPEMQDCCQKTNVVGDSCVVLTHAPLKNTQLYPKIVVF